MLSEVQQAMCQVSIHREVFHMMQLPSVITELWHQILPASESCLSVCSIAW